MTTENTTTTDTDTATDTDAETTQTTEAATETPNTNTDTDTGTGTDTGKGSRDAARYRTALRAVETERDDLRAQLDTMRRAEVERLAAVVLANGADLFAHRGDDLTPYLDEHGAVDPELVAAAAHGLVTERGNYLARRRFGGNADGGARTQSGSGGTTWRDALSGSRGDVA